MRIIVFSEANYVGKPDQSMLGRTDVNWVFSLDAYHMNINYLDLSLKFDVGIYIIPKNNPVLNLEFLDRIRQICDKVGIMQESDQIYWQRYSVPDQIQWLNFVSEVDFILCHNEIDINYYSGLFPSKPVSILPTLLLHNNLNKADIIPKERRSGCMIGGTWCDWYSGQDSFMIAQEFNCKLFAPSMGRKDEYEDYFEDIQYLSYKGWTEWMYDLSKCKYAVHLMRTYAAGSFSLNCAYLKIPCIGWNSLDTQRILFPGLSPNEGDMVEARRIAKHLYSNQLFYDHVTEYAYKQYLDIYHEMEFKENIINFLSDLWK